jgi:hypothetical protein
MRRLRRAWLLFPPPEDLLARIVGSFTVSIGSFTFNLGSFASSVGSFTIRIGSFIFIVGSFAVSVGRFIFRVSHLIVGAGEFFSAVGGFDMVDIDIGAIPYYRIPRRGGALAGTSRIRIAIEVGVADIRAGTLVALAFFRVGSSAGSQTQVQAYLMRQTGRSVQIAAAIGRVAGTECACSMTAANATVPSSGQIIGVETAGSHIVFQRHVPEQVGCATGFSVLMTANATRLLCRNFCLHATSNFIIRHLPRHRPIYRPGRMMPKAGRRTRYKAFCRTSMFQYQ